MSAGYTPPVDRLLTLGESPRGPDWLDYRELGLGEGDVPELTRMVADEALMEQALAADRVDIMLRGDREDVQVDLRLIPARTTPRPNWDVGLPPLPRRVPRTP